MSMESLKGWITGFRRPQTRMIQQQTAHSTDTERQLPHPVRRGLQPIKRPVHRNLGNRCLKTSFPICKTGNVIPAKRTVEQDEHQDDVPPKRPKFQEVSPSQTADRAVHRAMCTEDQPALENGKRPRAESTDDERIWTRRAKIVEDVLDLADTDEEDQVRADIVRGLEESVSPTQDSDSANNAVKNTSDQITPVSLPDAQSEKYQTSGTKSSELGSLVRELKSKSSISLRRQAKVYVTSREDVQRHTSKDSFGVGLWSGSNGIPGGRKRGDNKPDGIEIPEMKPKRMVQFNLPSMEDSKGRPCDQTGKQQMRLSRPCWRFHRFGWVD